MSVINQEDFFGQIEQEFDHKQDNDPSKQEQRQYENLTTSHQYQLDALENEFGVMDEKTYIKAMKVVLQYRHLKVRAPRIDNLSRMKLKKYQALTVAMGEVTEFFFSDIVGMTSEVQSAVYDPLHAESSRFYVKDPGLYQKAVALTNAPGSPTAQFVKRTFCDARGNALPYNDWVIEIREPKRTYHLELPFVHQNDAVNAYLENLLEKCYHDEWVASVKTL